MASIEIHIAAQHPAVAKMQQRLLDATQRTANKIAELLPLKKMDIVLAHNPKECIEFTGFGGYSPDPHTVFVYFDANSPHFENSAETTLSRTLAHEMHHASRSIKHPWIEPSLLESFIAEGLADHFDIELNGAQPYPWSQALDEKTILQYIQQAQKADWLKPGGKYWEWNFSSSYPKWTGYSIGFYLVQKYKEASGKNAAELVHEDAQMFIHNFNLKP